MDKDGEERIVAADWRPFLTEEADERVLPVGIQIQIQILDSISQMIHMTDCEKWIILLKL